MFLHHTMTDADILRSCEGCTSSHLRLVADRLRTRSDQLREVVRLADVASIAYAIDDYLAMMDAIKDIERAASPDE